MKNISFNDFHPFQCEITETDDGINLTAENEGFIYLECGNLNNLFSNGYLCVDAFNQNDFLAGLGFCFWEGENELSAPDLIAVMGLMPGLKTRIALPLAVLNGQTLYLKRTPGKLKTTIIGRSIKPEKISRFAIGLQKRHRKQTVALSALCISDTEPDYPFKPAAIIDSFGQLIPKSYDGKIKDETDLRNRLVEEASKHDIAYQNNSDHYGGFKEKRFNQTGYFTIQKDNGIYWLADPDGCAFLSIGIDCIQPGEYTPAGSLKGLFEYLPDMSSAAAQAYLAGENGPDDYFSFGMSNLIRAFGEDWYDNWCRLTKNRLISWGMNTIGCWSSDRFVKWSKMPYALSLTDFPTTDQCIFRDFPDVFSPEYDENAAAFAKQLERLKNDRYLIGYFLRNEPQWAFVKGLNLAEKLFLNKNDFYSKKEMIRILFQKYGDIDKLNEEWKTHFPNFDDLRNPENMNNLSENALHDLHELSKILIDRFVEVPSTACKKVDKNHLNLGMRYAFISDPIILSGSRHLDVFSINCYKFDPCEEITRIGELTGLPVMIGEFHFGALDGATFATGIQAVPTQSERGNAYRYYIENAAANPYFIGAHYFELYDQETAGRYDGECYQIGFVDVCSGVYEKFADTVSFVNKQIYDIRSGKTIPCKNKAEQIPMIGF